MRSAYLDDLRSKFLIENSILKMEYAEARVVDLSQRVRGRGRTEWGGARTKGRGGVEYWSARFEFPLHCEADIGLIILSVSHRTTSKDCCDNMLGGALEPKRAGFSHEAQGVTFDQ